MKLRVKLTLSSIALIATAILLCCLLILSFARRDVLADVVESGLYDYQEFYSGLFGALVSPVEITPPVQYSFVLNAFHGVSGAAEFTLRLGGEFLSNNVGFDVESALDGARALDPYSTDSRIVRVAGKRYFIACGALEFNGDIYGLSMARDISDTMRRVRALAIKCAISGAAVMAAAAVLMRLIVFRALEPIKTLQAGANRLAGGAYESRIPVTGKDELAALASDFNAMADAIEENVRALHETAERRQAFINDLSHELKTPVTSIMLCSETLIGRKLPPEQASRSLERIYNQSRWLERLSQKLMTLVLLQGEIRARPESVPSLLSSVAESVAAVLGESGVKLQIECELDTLEMDVDLLRSALVNLVDNARKASRAGQSVTLRAYERVIEVADRGRGIPREEIERVTEPFYVADRSRSRKYGGGGLGLTLVKRIADAHGARLAIESALGHGTIVRLIFDGAKQ